MKKISEEQNKPQQKTAEPKIKPILYKIGMSLIAVLISYQAIYWIAENYFFDKFFYHKSIKHGYVLQNKDFYSKDFGERSEDNVELRNRVFNTSFNQNKVLGSSNTFNIAIIGDSLVWGVGIRDDQRFAKILEYKLDSIQPTNVLSFSNSGDNIFDHLIKYELVENSYDIDLYIFALVNNDLLLQLNGKIIQSFYEKMIAQVPNLSNYFLDEVLLCNDNYVSNEIYNHISLEKYLKAMNDSFSNEYGNICLFRILAPKFPRNSIFFTFGENFDEKKHVEKYYNYFKELNYFVLSDSSFSSWKNYSVSYLEGHPGPEANKSFANILYEEITHNSKWNFTQN